MWILASVLAFCAVRLASGQVLDDDIGMAPATIIGNHCAGAWYSSQCTVGRTRAVEYKIAEISGPSWRLTWVARISVPGWAGSRCLPDALTL
jgi:hypothetical protein